MIIFISGGCKNGKSSHAERLSKALSKENPPLYYIATMEPVDNEDLTRIDRHRQSRAGLGFKTLEIPRNLSELKESFSKGGTYLLDSLTALLANEMFVGESINEAAAEKIIGDLEVLMQENANFIIVSDYICSDAEKYDEISELYRRQLAAADRFCAKKADIVLESVGASLICYKGETLLENI